MAIDPRISLNVGVPQTSPAIQIFENALISGQNREIAAAQEARRAELAPLQQQAAQQRVDIGQQQIDTEAENRIIRSISEFSPVLKPLLESSITSGDTSRALSAIDSRIDQLQRSQLPVQESIEARNKIAQGDIQGALNDLSAIDAAAASRGLGPSARAGQRAFAPIVDPATGQLGVPTFDPATGAAGFQTIPGAPVQQTEEQKREAEIRERERISKIAVSETEKKAVITQRVQRTSAIKKELSDRNRSAARSQRPLKQALKLAEKASQGLSGSAKLQLSRLVPGIDATNEAALDATLKQLALEQLQQFKGPTTDFEFGVTQSIAGALGESATSNIARIKSLDRNNWFNQREFSQFQDHVNSGGDPDTFSFNFGEPVKTKKGVFTLQDLQDTAVDNNLTIEETLQRLNK